MHPALLVLAVMQGTTLPPGARPAGPPPASALPAPASYAIDFKLTQEFDQGAGKPKLTGDVMTKAFVTVTLSDTTGGRLAHVAVDSLRITGTGIAANAVPAAMVAAAKGAYFHGYIVGGRVQGVLKASIPSNAALGLVQQTLSALFPWVRPGAKAGDKWTDTLTMNAPTTGDGESGTTVTHWKVSAMDADVYVLDETGELKTSSVKGGFLVREAKGTNTQHIESPMGGPARKATVQETTDIQQVQPGTTTVIPGKRTTMITIAKM